MPKLDLGTGLVCWFWFGGFVFVCLFFKQGWPELFYVAKDHLKLLPQPHASTS